MMRAAKTAAAFALLTTAVLAEPAFEQHYSPAENLEAFDVALIDSAGETVDMAAYVLADRAVIEALTLAAERGVRVRIYRWSGEARQSQAIDALAAAGAEVRYKPPHTPLMHLKTYCVDGQTLRFGAANFSRSGLTKQDNDLEIERGPHACDAFEADFERMWRASD